MTKYSYSCEVYDSHEEALEEALKFIDESELIPLWNDYCYDTNDFENVIHYMEEFDEYCCNITPSDIVQNLTSDFNIRGVYFIDGVYGFKSFDYPESIVDYFKLACWLSDRKDTYECCAFSEIEEVEEQGLYLQP